MKNILIIGAGQIGSRHLQALKAVRTSIQIFVVDPSPESLKTAKKMYELTRRGESEHMVRLSTKLPHNPEQIDVAIIATNSDVRREACETLLERTDVRHLIFEKILFNHKKDYDEIGLSLRKHKTKAYVNFNMRMHPMYSSIKDELGDDKIFYHVSGGNFGLVTNAIHYLDHLALLAHCRDFTINTNLLDHNPIPSKRKGFLEFTGTIEAKLKNGSQMLVTSYETGGAPCQIIIFNKNMRIISRENEGKFWIAKKENSWSWQEILSPWPYQSEMTTHLVERLLHKGECSLPTYQESIKIHLQMLEPLLEHLNRFSKKKYNYYPFT